MRDEAFLRLNSSVLVTTTSSPMIRGTFGSRVTPSSIMPKQASVKSLRL